MKRVSEPEILLDPKYPGVFNKIYNCLKKDDSILSVIYDKEQYIEFKEWYFNVTGGDSDMSLGKYKNPKSNQKYALQGTYTFPVCISIGDTGIIGHQGATHNISFKKILKRDNYDLYLILPLDVIINFDNYPEYHI